MQIQPFTIAVSTAGMTPTSHAEPRELIGQVSGWGGRAIVLDATAKGLRPRELDRTARRDLGATLRRNELHFAGIDFFLPPEHLVNAALVDRAMSAITQAMELTAELASLTSGHALVRTCLHANSNDEILESLGRASERSGVVLADHRWPPGAGTPAQVGIGIDPALVLAAGSEPGAELLKLPGPVVAARLSDWSGVTRVGVGDGRLDQNAYLVSLMAKGYHGELVLDLRGVADQERAARRVLARGG